MSRVAALYDIHGNVPALEAVLAELDAETIVVGGDVAAGPWPAETLARLRSLGDQVVWIRGNADRELVTPSNATEGGPPQAVLEWTGAKLGDDDRRFLGALPLTASIDVDGIGRVLFCHATPRSDDELLTGVSDEALWRDAIEGVDAKLVVCGHTHVQFMRDIAGRRVVNAGSVGMPYEREPGAYWLALGPSVEHRRTPYDVVAAAAAIEAVGWPEEWPEATPEEATEFFERAVRARTQRA